MRIFNSKFPVEDKGELTWVLQVRVDRDRPKRSISLSQESYVKDIVSRFDHTLDGLTRRFDSPHDASVKLSHEDSPNSSSKEASEMEPYRSTYMSLIGAYLWLANVTRYDLCFISSQLAKFVSNPGWTHYRAALRVLIYLKGTSTKALVLNTDCAKLMRAFVDSDWGTSFSVSGGFVEFRNCLVHWFARTQKSISMSSTEAEYFATSVMVKELIFFRDLLSDFGFAPQEPTVIFTDNKGVVDLSYDPVAFKKTKHILRAAEFVRDRVTRCYVLLRWISGDRNIADLCTKSVSLPVFRLLMKLCSMPHTIS